MAWKVPLALFLTVASSSSRTPCSDITHSDCEIRGVIDDIDVADKQHCKDVCLALGSRCRFFIYKPEPFADGNCLIIDESFSNIIRTCNEVTGPREGVEGCDIMSPPDNSCQVYRTGDCRNFAFPEESFHLASLENCRKECRANSNCKYWRFFREESLCYILNSEDRKCEWEFGPKDPEVEDCSTLGPCITDTGKSCVFPFIEQGKKYNGCTYSGGWPKPFCATKVDQNGKLVSWGYCPVGNRNCPIELIKQSQSQNLEIIPV